jgi:hypothetical protein
MTISCSRRHKQRDGSYLGTEMGIVIFGAVLGPVSFVCLRAPRGSVAARRAWRNGAAYWFECLFVRPGGSTSRGSFWLDRTTTIHTNYHLSYRRTSHIVVTSIVRSYRRAPSSHRAYVNRNALWNAYCEPTYSLSRFVYPTRFFTISSEASCRTKFVYPIRRSVSEK